ncbi:LOW QUALITY PROTEIN: probable inactive receptor kinase At5g10020 [Primulina eburnea]|uniref:LOW QUALITY PROTEIN: probable inactive receptor kinase At5g10020 n=1 Tax=Primulina eburnea TaxID=1245227 RepID=UPI003C6C51FC
MTIPPILTLFLTFHLLIPLAYAAEEEVRSLLEFRKGIKSDPSNLIFSTWTPPSNYSACPDAFHGVACDPFAHSIVAISLDHLGLSGDLKFNTLIPLKLLQNLTLSGNFLSGRLVPTLGQMSSLQVMDLSGNQFYGPIPARFNDLWALHYVNFSNNNFSGGFPAGIRNLQQLKVLDLHSNNLQGSVAELIPELRNVEYLDLSRNAFSGSLELSVDNVSSLANTVKYVNLSGNGLTGGFWRSDAMMLFRNLRVLDLGDNGIGGQLPDFRQLPNLQILRLANNGLYGSVPEDLLQAVVPLVELDLSHNGFSGSIPKINSTTLDILNLSSNSISGLLPPSLGNCRIVDLSRNLLSDDITVLKTWNANLEVLDLSFNNLTGGIPNATQFQSLTVLSIRNNSLYGILPLLLGSYPKITTVDLSSNRLDGSIPPSFFTSTTMKNLNLSCNQLTGPIPLEGAHTNELLVLPSVPPMEFLDLSNNLLMGELPSDIGNWGRLNLLNLSYNNLSGLLPNELSKLSGLEVLNLSHNNFNGHIPDRLPSSMKLFDVAYNNLSGNIPDNLENKFPISSFYPGNGLLVSRKGFPNGNHGPNGIQDKGKHHSSKSSIRVAIIVASVGAAVMIAFVLLAYHRARFQEFRARSGFCGQTGGRDVKTGRFSRPSLFSFHSSMEPPPTSLSFSNDHLLTSNSRSLPGQMESGSEMPEGVAAGAVSINSSLEANHPTSSGRKSPPGSPIASSLHVVDTIEPVSLDVYSPDRLAGELFFLDASLKFTAEELSRAPAEVLGRSSHGTMYKATLDNGHMLTVKWLRVGLVKHKKEFSKEVKKLGSLSHPNIVPLRAYYWGPREQERLILADYVLGDSLALHLYETTPRRYPPLSFSQRLKVAVDVARSLMFLHDRGQPHGNLKPTNILIAGHEYIVRLTDYGLHRLMTPAGIAEQILNLGALGYRAPELASTAKPIPSCKADIYAFGVIMMEMLTRRSAGDIISGQSGAVDLTDWVRLYNQEGRGMECMDRDIAGGEQSKAIDDMLDVSLRCILPVNERPNIRQVIQELSSISV